MYPYQGRGSSQQPPPPPPPGSSGYNNRGPSRSPEQTRASIARSVPHSPGGMSNHSHHEENWHRGNSGNPTTGLEMREVNYPPQSRYSGSGRDRGDDYSNRVGHWMDDRKYGPPPPSSRQQQQQQSHPPPPSRSIDERGRNYNQNPPPHFSHPPSPSQRPRTPPPSNSRNVIGGGDGGSRTSPWDPMAAGPMSAPPSMVPRIHPNQSSSHGVHHSNAASHHTSPLLPALSHESGRSSSEGLGNNSGNPNQMNSHTNSGHHRIPSWGTQSAKEGMTIRSPPRNMASAPSSNANRMGGGGGGPGTGPYRGESMGTYNRNAEMINPSQRSMDNRKRPASESPPTTMGRAPLPPQQTSPSQRADVMSMSSILGPSGVRASSVVQDFAPETDPVMNSAEKRRRLEAGKSSPSRTTDNGAPTQGRISNGSANGSNTINVSMSEAAAANLARRKWSGPIAEEAAQQAAAWRAQEQRWGAGGNTRSPKVGILPLGGGAAGERQNSPFGGQRSNLGGRGQSPIAQEGHRRQRSDGLQAPPGSVGQPPVDTRSPLARTMPLRPPSPPPTSSTSQQAGRAQSKPPKQQQQQQQQQQPPPLPPHSQQQHQGGPGGFGGAPPPGYYRGATPPPPGANLGPHSGNGMQQQHFPPQHQQQMYNQPSYHAYDSQGRPVEIDVDEVRGGAFAGHGNHPPPPPHMTEAGYRHAMGQFEEPPMMMQQQQQQQQMSRPSQMQNSQSRREPAPSSQGHAKKSSMHQENKGNIPQRSANQQQQGPPTGSQQPSKQLRRSLSPVMPGPARGLLPPRLEKQRPLTNDRPLVASKDFNIGPKVDSDAVRVALKEAIEAPRGLIAGPNTAQIGQEEHSINADSEYSIPFGKHLGSFIYDARKTPLLPGDLLRRNVGATLEVRIPGKALGVGPQNEKDREGVLHGRWAVNSEMNKDSSNNPNNHTNGNATNVSESDADIDAFAFWNNDVFLKRKAWGTDVYTDDSDVVMMCLHAGYLLGPKLESVPTWVPPGKAVNAWKRMTDDLAARAKNGELEENDNAILSATAIGPDSDQVINLSPESIKGRNERLDKTMDISVILRVAPQLIAYKGSQRGGVKTRSWGNTHDGVSLVIESVQLQPSGYASGERGLKRMKQRIDQLARLKMLATIAGDAGAIKENIDQQVPIQTSSKDQLSAGGLLDILAAARLISNENESNNVNDTENALETPKRFWQFDPMIDVKAA